MMPADASSFRLTLRPHPSLRKSRAGSDCGVALVTVLLLLSLMTVLTLAMVVAVSSDTLIAGYYRNFRGAFYAADSGLNIARQDMVNQVGATVPATFNVAVPPIPAGTDAAVQAAILSQYGTKTSINAGTAAGSWPGSFSITAASLALVTNPPQPVISRDAVGNPTNYQYTYKYSLTSVGQALAGEQTELMDSGNLIINAVVSPAGGVTTSFAAWGMFIDQYAICSGSYLVPGTITGPVFTNGAWTFGTAGAYIFTDLVGSVSPLAGYQFPGVCKQSPTSPVTQAGRTIAPQFQAGFDLGQPRVPLPPNDYDQKRAVLDGMGVSSGNPVTASDLNNSLRNLSGTQYPNSGATSGVWLPYSVNPLTGQTTFTGGGIYVEGNAQVTMSTSGASAEVWTITQGTTTTVITIDPSANTTTVFSNGATNTVSGVPLQKNPDGSAFRPATMLYVNGSITSLKGPGQGLPAIQDGAAITITAAANVTVTGDIIYKTPPVTKTQNDPCCPGTPADTLIPGNHKGQVLGIFTATGDILLQNSQANGNLEIDASLATLSQGGAGGVINTGSAINTLTIVGGRIQNRIKNINSRTRNVFFDRRFTQGGFAPPWFPATTLTVSGVVSTTVNSSVQRVQWLNKTAL